MVDLPALNALLVSLARSSDVLDISRNTYVALAGGEEGTGRADGGTRTPSSGMLADLDQAGSAGGTRAPSGTPQTDAPAVPMSRVAAMMLTTQTGQPDPDAVPSQSLAGLRTPQTAGTAPVQTSASNPDANEADGQASERGTSTSGSAVARSIDGSSALPVAGAAPTKSGDDTEAATSSPVPHVHAVAARSADAPEASTSSNAIAGPVRDPDDEPIAKIPVPTTSGNAQASGDTAGANRPAGVSDRVDRASAEPSLEAAARRASAEQPLRRDRAEAFRASEPSRSEAVHAGASPDKFRADAPPAPARDAVPTDGFGLRTEAAAGLQLERAGVIASFILNAAMIPGWPPPRPFAVPGQEELLGNLARATALPTDVEFLALLKQRGTKPALLARLRDLLAKLSKSRRLRVLLGLAALDAAIESVLDAIEEELTRLAHRDEEQEHSQPAEGWHRLSV